MTETETTTAPGEVSQDERDARANTLSAIAADIRAAGAGTDATSDPQHGHRLASLFEHVAAHLRRPAQPHPDTVAQARSVVSGLSDDDVRRIAAEIERSRRTNPEPDPEPDPVTPGTVTVPVTGGQGAEPPVP